MDDPTLDELLEAFVSPYVSRVSPAFAAAHLLVAGADGPALRELAGLSEQDFAQALELLPAATQEAAVVLRPALDRLHAEAPDEPAPAVELVWRSADLGEDVDALAAWLDGLAGEVERAGLGELDGPVDEAEEQVVLAYGTDLAALQAFLAERTQAAPVRPHRVAVRP